MQNIIDEGEIEGEIFKGFLDTCTHDSIISQCLCPIAWPLNVVTIDIQGTGNIFHPSRSAKFLTWRDVDGHFGHLSPYVLLHIPVDLWGYDVLQNMVIFLISPDSLVTR